MFGLVRSLLTMSLASISKQIKKTLVPIVGTAQLDSLPPRVLRFRLRLTRFDYSIAHVPGMFLYRVDTLSCAPIKTLEYVYEDDKDVKRFIETLAEQLPASRETKEQFRKAQKDDSIWLTVIRMDGQQDT